MLLDRVDGDDELYVGGIFALRKPDILEEKKITSVLSVIKYSFEGWGERAKRFKHLSIDVDDVDDEDLLAHLSSAVRFIDRGLHPSPDDEDSQDPAAGTNDDDDTSSSPPSKAVYVHCAMGKSRSVTCIVAYLLYKYPHRYGGGNSKSSSTAQRRETASKAVTSAVEWVRQTRQIAEPNPGFMRQLELWWEMGCPAGSDDAVENHPIYQKWLYENKLREARDAGMAPEADWIRFEDEAEPADAEQSKQGGQSENKELRCKKCRRVLANSQFVVDHQQGTATTEKYQEGSSKTTPPPCQHIFVETLSWMRPYLEDGTLEGRLICPNAKCNAIVGRFAWQGFKCTCKEWVCPAFSLNRSRVDEADVRSAAGMGIRMPPGRNGSL